jgi:hypothetical protein
MPTPASGTVPQVVEIPYRQMRPEIQAFAHAKDRLVITLMGDCGGLCPVFAVLDRRFGIVKSVTEFPPNKIHYRNCGELRDDISGKIKYTFHRWWL